MNPLQRFFNYVFGPAAPAPVTTAPAVATPAREDDIRRDDFIPRTPQAQGTVPLRRSPSTSQTSTRPYNSPVKDATETSPLLADYQFMIAFLTKIITLGKQAVGQMFAANIKTTESIVASLQ